MIVSIIQHNAKKIVSIQEQKKQVGLKNSKLEIWYVWLLSVESDRLTSNCLKEKEFMENKNLFGRCGGSES